MIDIILYTNNSENNKMDKNLTTIATIQGQFRSSVDIINPVFRIEATIEQISALNYIYIQSFNRYYFVNNITNFRAGEWDISCHVDVLMSFKNNIRQCKAIIKKQANKWNLYLDDGSFKVYQNPNILTKSFPSGFTNYDFVLAVAGGINNVGS